MRCILLHIPKFIMNQGSYIANTKSKIHISSSRVLLADRNGQYFNCRTFRRNCLNNSERATVGLEIIQFARLWNNGPNSRLRRAYFRTNSFVITSMVTYSVQRECAMVLWESVIYAIWKMLYLARRATDAYDCTEWPLIIHNACSFRKYSRCFTRTLPLPHPAAGFVI